MESDLEKQCKNQSKWAEIYIQERRKRKREISRANNLKYNKNKIK
jgi:hypothetical protein